MNLIKTTTGFKSGEKGNCLATALACLLSLDVQTIPEFQNMTKDTWKPALFNWADSINVTLEFTHDIPDGFSIGIGRKTKENELHAVILLDGDFYFDTGHSDTFYDEHRYCIKVTQHT